MCPASAASAVLLLLLFAAPRCASAAPPGWAGVLDVRDYGAVGDGATLDTAAIRKALGVAAAAGGGTVLFPPGYRFLTRPFNVTSNVALEVQGVVAFRTTRARTGPSLRASIGSDRRARCSSSRSSSAGASATSR